MIIKQITFGTILPIWQEQLWPGRISPIEPYSAMRFMDNKYEVSFAKNPQIFLGGYIDDNLIAVTSIHLAEKYMARHRGLWVDSTFRGKGYGTNIINEALQYAKQLGVDAVWSFPRKSSMSAHLKCGYIQISPWVNDGEFGPNCYAISPLA